MTPVWACVNVVCWRKGLQLLSVPVLFISQLPSEMCSNGLLCLYSSCSPWWDTTCFWTWCIFMTSSIGPSQVLLCAAAVPGCCLCAGGGTGGAVAICHHRHLQGLASSGAGCLFWVLNAGAHRCQLSLLFPNYFTIPLDFPQFPDAFLHMCFAFRKLWGV